MKPQDPPQSQLVGHTFEGMIDSALTQHVAYKKTLLHAFDVGIRAPELFRYAFGRLGDKERQSFTELLARSPWAMERVVALVKYNRGPREPRVLLYDRSGQDELTALKLLEQF